MQLPPPLGARVRVEAQARAGWRGAVVPIGRAPLSRGAVAAARTAGPRTRAVVLCMTRRARSLERPERALDRHSLVYACLSKQVAGITTDVPASAHRNA